MRFKFKYGRGISFEFWVTVVALLSIVTPFADPFVFMFLPQLNMLQRLLVIPGISMAMLIIGYFTSRGTGAGILHSDYFDLELGHNCSTINYTDILSITEISPKFIGRHHWRIELLGQMPIKISPVKRPSGRKKATRCDLREFMHVLRVTWLQKTVCHDI